LVEKQKKKPAVRNGRKTRSKKCVTQEKAIDDALATLHLSSSSIDEDEDDDSSQGDSGEELEEDNATSPKCDISYFDSSEKWIQCDGCDMWFNKKCTNIKGRVPKEYYCETCAL